MLLAERRSVVVFGRAEFKVRFLFVDKTPYSVAILYFLINQSENFTQDVEKHNDSIDIKYI